MTTTFTEKCNELGMQIDVGGTSSDSARTPCKRLLFRQFKAVNGQVHISLTLHNTGPDAIKGRRGWESSVGTIVLHDYDFWNVDRAQIDVWLELAYEMEEELFPFDGHLNALKAYRKTIKEGFKERWNKEKD